MKENLDLLALFAVTIAVAFGIVPTGFDASSIGYMVLGYFMVAMVFLWGIPGVGMELSDRLNRFGNIALAITAALYTLPIAAVTYVVSLDLCLLNERSATSSGAFAMLATALAVFAASNNFFSAICDNRRAYARQMATKD